ncbi:type I pullulanase [Candidatus Cloacimonadota bacterium]
MKKFIFFVILFSITLLSALDLTIHYHRYEGDYEDWGLHLWNAVEESGGTFIIDGVSYSWWDAYPFANTDDFGVFAVVPILYEDLDLGFIVHKGEEKDPPGLDRFYGDYETADEIWLLEGIAEIFFEEPSTDVRMMSAFGDGVNTITVNMTSSITEYTDRFQVLKESVLEPLNSVVSDDGVAIELILTDPIDITIPYEVHDVESDETISVIHQFPEDDFIYEGDDLGFTWSVEETVFKLWSPAASTANVLIYQTPTDTEEEPEYYPMTRVDDGVLSCTVAGDLKNLYYMFEVTLTGVTTEAQDPYSRGISTNSSRSLIFDSADTDPPDWDQDQSPVLEHPCDAVIYEMHIRDLTINETWGGDESVRGKYLGVIESGTTYEGYPTGLDHLIDLGVNCVQILPMYDYGSVDETNPMSRNWGYDPMAYNCPEGGYSSDPTDITRILEMKTMIKGLHDAGIKVIMDVVYNHTYYSGDGSFFDQVVPNYYYYLDDTGGYINWTGTGNTINSYKPMVNRFIKQSVKYWVEEYHIDGFRFDLMGLTDTDLMEEIVDELQEIKPDILVYGEPWGGWGAPVITGKGDQRGLGFGCFNDNIRNGIRGDTDGFALGYPMGNTGNWSAVQRGVMGSIYDFTDGPSETINYLSAHDNYTWYDKLIRTMPEVSETSLEDMNKMGMAIVMTSQGIAFMHAGSEFMRTKRAPGATEEEVRNSYNANDDVNKLDWARKAEYIHINEYYKGLIELRKSRPEFRLQTAEEINDHLHMYDTNPEATMTFILDDISPGDSWGDILVSYNPNSEGKYLDLPEGTWTVVVNNYQAGVEPVSTGTATFNASIYGGSFYVAPNSALVMFKSGTAPSLHMSIFQNPGLSNFLHFAVNAAEDFEEIALSVNDADLLLEQLEGNSWIADYELTGTGNMQAILTVDDYTLIRNFSIGSIGRDGGSGRSYDGKVMIQFPAEAVDNNMFFAIFRKDDIYEIGTNNVLLQEDAIVKFQATDDNKAIYRRSGDLWIELPTIFLNGYVTAQTDRLGEFKLDEAINSIPNTSILGNYPNPFNPDTEISFQVSAKDDLKDCRIEIYNIKGQLVRILIDEPFSAGIHKVIWNGKDNGSNPVASGVYFFNLRIDSRSLTHKMLLLK